MEIYDLYDSLGYNHIDYKAHGLTIGEHVLSVHTKSYELSIHVPLLLIHVPCNRCGHTLDLACNRPETLSFLQPNYAKRLHASELLPLDSDLFSGCDD